MDVVISGGGCAGAATALALLRHDPALRVAVVEASEYGNHRIGESLSPRARPLLRRLGVWDAFLADAHLASHGTSAAWGSAAPHDNEYLLSPWGEGWHLDRPRFDAMLARQAAERGAVIHTGARLLAGERRGGYWNLEARRGEERIRLEARFVVDATGRRASFARRRGIGTLRFDRLLGIYGFFSPESDAPLAKTTYSVVEAWREGWWYAARLADGRLAVACMSDADRVKAIGLRQREAFLAELEKTRSIRNLTRNSRLEGDLSCHAAHTQRLDRVIGDGWLAVGDAATTYDPLSAHGIFKGLRLGIFAAYAASDHLQGRVDALAKYQAMVWNDFEGYLGTREEYYSRERRFAEAPFWRRRSLPSSATHP